MLTIPANPFVYDLQRILGTILIPDSFSLSDYLFADEKLLTTLF